METFSFEDFGEAAGECKDEASGDVGYDDYDYYDQDYADDTAGGASSAVETVASVSSVVSSPPLPPAAAVDLSVLTLAEALDVIPAPPPHFDADVDAGAGAGAGAGKAGRRGNQGGKMAKSNASSGRLAADGSRGPRSAGSGMQAVVNWRSVSGSMLSRHPRYAALPSPSRVPLRGIGDVYRYRQGSWQAEALHRGRLTTRYIAPCLGLHESKAGKTLKFSNAMRRHGQVLSAYRHLSRTTPITLDELGRQAFAGCRIVLAPRSEDRPTQRWKLTAKGRIESLAYPSLVMNVGGCDMAAGAWVIAWPTSKTATNESWRLKQGRARFKSEGGPPHLLTIESCLSSMVMQGVAGAGRAAGSGDAVTTPVSLMPKRKGEAFQQWAIEDDGRIRCAGGARGGAGSGASTDLVLDICDDLDGFTNSDGLPWEWAASIDAANGVVGAFTHTLCGDEGSGETPKLTPVASVDEVRREWGSVQEETGLLTAMNVFPSASLQETGLHPLEALPTLNEYALRWGLRSAADLPLIGASPDGILVHPNGILEAVEIKTVCPFQVPSGGGKSKGGGKGKSAAKLAVIDPGPKTAGQFPCAHVAQVQCEMLCTGTHTCVYVSLSATRGATIFRVHRNEEFIALMMVLLRRFFDEFVYTQTEPPENFFSHLPEHVRLVELTASIAQGAVVESCLDHEQVQRPDGPSSWFVKA